MKKTRFLNVIALTLMLMMIAVNALAAISNAGVGDPIVPAESAKGVIDIILQHGITGALLVVVLYGYHRKDRALEAERQARIDDAKEHVADAERYGETMVAMQDRVTTNANKLIDLAGAWERLTQQRDIADARERHREHREEENEARRDDTRRTGPQRPR